jgi:tetratricopeptide (TPR) repeat protein
LTACTTSTAPVVSEDYADFLIARTAHLERDYGLATDRYLDALARGGSEREAFIDGAMAASLASGDIERARRVASSAPVDETAGYARLVRAAEALIQGRAARAAALVEPFEGAAAQELVATVMLTWARTGQGQIDEVLIEPQALAHLHPYAGLFAYQQAMALEVAGRPEEALASYADAAGSGFFLPSAIERHADLLARRGAREDAIALLDTEQARANPALAAALARLRAGEPVATQRLTLARGCAISVFALSLIYLQEQDSASGLAALTLALMLDNRLDAARVRFAQEQARFENYDLARESLAAVGEGSPYAGPARLYGSWLVYQSGARDEAIALARANAERAEPDAVRTLADMLRSAGRYEEAEPLYATLIAQDASDWRLYFSRGVTRERLGRWPEAEADFQEALRLEPDQPDTLNYLGYAWVDRGERIEEALEMIQRALAQRPRSGAIVDSLGWAYYRLGRYENARDILELAAALSPDNAEVNDHLGDLYWRLGRRVEARLQWRRALSLGPENPEAIEAKLAEGLGDEGRVDEGDD